ncbi:MAG: VPA1262 family N-terminal domain-containing protein [Methanobacteriaceae archaeon]
MGENNGFHNINDFETLIHNGNIGFYQSCEVTEIFIHNNINKENFNFFTLCVFEEKPYIDDNFKFITKNLTKIDKNHSLGIKRYSLSIKKIKENFNVMLNENEWKSNDSDVSLMYHNLRFIPKQFIPPNNRRLNNVLKNNFHGGSYILEFFDENKNNFDFLLNSEIKQNLLNIIQEHTHIFLSTVSDRIGNFIFQFPITIVEIGSKISQDGDGLDFEFFWNPNVESKPSCVLQVETVLDGNYMNQINEKYNGTPNQKLIINNFQEGTVPTIKFSRKNPYLILNTSDYGYIQVISSNFSVNVGHSEPRIFKINGKDINIPLKNIGTNYILSDDESSESLKYYEHIIHKKNDIEKEELIKKLDFKEYTRKEGIDDLRELIKEHGKNGVYLWDPYLDSEDIINTLFYSEYRGVELRALSDLKDIKIQECIDFFDNNLETNNLGLNIEFRVRKSYGHRFHDRFLIFPGNLKNLENPKVYSLGTSVNGYYNKGEGINMEQSYHILQKVLYPQPIIDAFNKLWNQLNDECVVWKHPK